MNFYVKRPALISSLFLLTFSVVARFLIKDLTNPDTDTIGLWYAYLYNNGWRQLADGQFSNYTPAYLYLLWASTFLDEYTGRLLALKLIPTIFDIPSAYFIYLIARLKYPKGDLPYLFAAIFFILPTVMLNSTGWGQIESCFTSFLILCLYLLLQEKPAAAMIAFGVAFSFKAQAVFLLPFLVVMCLKAKLRWQHFFLIPLVYLLMALPSIFIGRSLESLLTIYVNQVGQYQSLSSNAPNLYVFAPNNFYDPGLIVGMLVFFAGMSVWVWYYWRSEGDLIPSKIVLIAFMSLALAPYLLPKMHDRYFYPADVFSLILAIFMPEMWLLPVLYQISSGISYAVFLIDAPVVFVKAGAIVNTFSILYLLKKRTPIFTRRDINDNT